MKIGFFDSGLGGLTILSAVAKELPQYDYEFFGDTENLPYGDKTEEEIFELTKKGIINLFAKDCLLVIVACNTSSAETLRKLQTEFLPTNYPDRKILGVIIPTIETLLELSIEKSFLIATNRTIQSKKYELELTKYKTPPKLTSVATPALVPLIEDSKYDQAFAEVCKIINDRKGEEAIILGCTHYTILSKKLIEKYTDEKIQIISQDTIIPDKLKFYLKNHPEIENRLDKNYRRNIFLTKNSKQYDNLLQELLGGTFI